MKKKIALTMTLVLAMSALAGCAGSSTSSSDTSSVDSAIQSASMTDGTTSAATTESSNSEAVDQFKKFDNPLDVHIAMEIDPTATDTLVDGDTMDNNYYTRYFKDNYNINIIVDWSASSADYGQKLALAISSDTLPDAFVCDTQYWKAASKAGQLKDLTDYFNTWTRAEIKGCYDTTDGAAWQSCMYDGEMTGFTGVNAATDGIHTIMIRQDWLDKLGLDAPKTLNDVENIAIAFRDAKLGGDNTIAILGASNNGELYSTFDNTFNCTFGFDPIFGAMNAYPGYFYTDDNGEVVYGSTTKEFRDSLELLAKWYQEGLIDPELGTRTTDMEPVNSGTVGMFGGSWWTIGYGNPSAFENDPDADWQAYAIYDDNGNWNLKQPNNYGTKYMCINANASDEVTQACMIIQNVAFDAESAIWNNETTEDIAWAPLRLAMTVADICEYTHNSLISVLKGETEPDDYKDETLYDGLYIYAQRIRDVVPNYQDGQMIKRKDMAIDFSDMNWQPIYSMLIGDRPYAEEKVAKMVPTIINGYTDSMNMSWESLKTLEKTTVLSIIVGKSDISAFDDFVTQWKAEGGDTILEEVKASMQQ